MHARNGFLGETPVVSLESTSVADSGDTRFCRPTSVCRQIVLQKKRLMMGRIVAAAKVRN